ncbi:MAG TPA: 1-deoxy-D-xylulose-5-phosphate reductoisomerase, partial [Elusimicrobiota bacterium]|nr:1-deoxy-D-xylulose-5-phosphate reductoisomerase [Elusimicrobiota bacterium]
PAVFNGANEVAVHAFLNGELSFTGIPTLCRRVLTAHRPASRTPGEDAGLSAILRADSWAREKARTLIDREKK